MTEENKEALEPEVPVEESQVEEVVEQPKEDPDKNWKEASRVMKLQQQKIQEMEALLHERTKPAPVEEKDEFAALDQEDYLTVGKARAMAEKLAEKKAEQAARKIVQEYAQQQQIQSDEQRVRAKHDDYDYVIENYAIPQIKNDPALAYKIQNSKNPAETAYKIGKLSDSYEESNAKQATSPKAEKILKNTQRPLSSNAAGSFKQQVDDFARMSKEDIWNQSQKFASKA